MPGFIVPESTIMNRKSPSAKAPIKLDYRRMRDTGSHLTELPEFKNASRKVQDLHSLLLESKSPMLMDGPVVMTGWKMESPFVSSDQLKAIEAAAKNLAHCTDCFVSIGIGGSYLGLRSTIEAVKGSLELTNNLKYGERGDIPQIFFLGHNMDPRYVSTVLKLIEGKKVALNVISKSGGTVEPAIAFAIMKNAMERSYSPADVVKKIVAITDAKKGALKKLADEKGYKSFVVPDNVGGRYSVTSPVGLFTLAVAGLDIHAFIAGVKHAEEEIRSNSFEKNISMMRAVLRFIAHKHLHKDIEVASTGTYDLQSTTKWMQQLGPESEGKNGEGLFISPEYYTEMAHANGQLIQEGKRNLIETFLTVEDPGVDIMINSKGTPVEYLDGKTLDFANKAFVDGLRDAHYSADVPTMSYILPKLDEYTMGMFYQYEMNAIALTGLLMGQNPFIQPGVQMYKKIADARSGKPGTTCEEDKDLNPKFVI